MESVTVISLLPKYRCHKVVRGGKIVNIKFNADDSAMLAIQLMPVEPTTEPVSVLMGDAWMLKHKPEVGGYFVAYEDGYLSYSPAAAFEEGYALVEPKPSVDDAIQANEPDIGKLGLVQVDCATVTHHPV